MTETRITNETTGGEKGQKPARMSYLPTGPLLTVAEHYAKGAEKYDDHNWRKGYDWSLSYDALQRHAMAFWAGEDIDEETGSPHMAAVVFHALALLEFAETHPELDNRYRATEQLVGGDGSREFIDKVLIEPKPGDLLDRLKAHQDTMTFTIKDVALEVLELSWGGPLPRVDFREAHSGETMSVDPDPMIVDTNEIQPELDEIVANAPKEAPPTRWGFTIGDRVEHAHLFGEVRTGTIISLHGDMPSVLWDAEVEGIGGEEHMAFPANLTVIEPEPEKPFTPGGILYALHESLKAHVYNESGERGDESLTADIAKQLHADGIIPVRNATELKKISGADRASVREILRATDGRRIVTTWETGLGDPVPSIFEFDHDDLVQFLDIIEDAGLEITHVPTSPLAD